MSTSKVLKELFELKEEYKQQNLQFTPAQKQRYAELLNKRREIVKIGRGNKGNWENVKGSNGN